MLSIDAEKARCKDDPLAESGFPHFPKIEEATPTVLFAAGMTETCCDCNGHGVLFSYPVLSHCFECHGRGVVLEVWGARDEDQRLYEELYDVEKQRIGRGLTFSERKALRQRVRNSR